MQVVQVPRNAHDQYVIARWVDKHLVHLIFFERKLNLCLSPPPTTLTFRNVSNLPTNEILPLRRDRHDPVRLR